MTSQHRRFGIALVLLGFVSILSATTEAQCPIYITQWGDGQFNRPTGLALDAGGNVYVADNDHRIQKFSDAPGDVFVVELFNHRVQKFTSTGTYLTQWGSRGNGDGQFNTPSGVATDAVGSVYVADEGNSRIQKFSSTGTYLMQWGSFGTGNGEFYFPVGVATDADGNVYVADKEHRRIQKFSSSGAYICQWGSSGTDDGQFDHPIGVAIDGVGNVYVAEYNNNRIRKFGPVLTPTNATTWGRIKGLYR